MDCNSLILYLTLSTLDCQHFIFLCLWAYGNSTNWYIWWSNNGRFTTYFHSFPPKPPFVGDFPARATFTATGATGPATPGPRSRSAPRSRGDATCQVSRLFLLDFQNGIFKTAEKFGMPSSNTIETWWNYSKLDIQTAGLRKSLFLSLAILGRLFWPIPVYSPLIKHGNMESPKNIQKQGSQWECHLCFDHFRVRLPEARNQ